MPTDFSFRRFYRSPLFLVVGGAVVIMIAVSSGREFYRNYIIEREIHALERQSKELEARRLELLNLAARLASGEFIEEEARVRLGLKKEGETAVVVRGIGEGEGKSEDAARKQSNARLWLDFFLHRLP